MIQIEPIARANGYYGHAGVHWDNTSVFCGNPAFRGDHRPNNRFEVVLVGPTPDYRTAYRCVSGGDPANIGSLYTLTNMTKQPVSLRLKHSSTGGDEDVSSIAPGATKSGVTNLRAGSVARGVISFRVNSVTPTSAGLLDTYYQASPALSC